MAYVDLEKKRANGRKWMRQWREQNPEESRRRGRDNYRRGIEKAKQDRLLPKQAWASVKNGANRRGFVFEIERGDFLIPERCPVLDIPLDWSSYANTPSVDRIDNAKGYTLDNTVVVSRRANLLKSSATIEELKALARFYG